jgi:hypothetical protein
MQSSSIAQKSKFKFASVIQGKLLSMSPYKNQETSFTFNGTE